MDSYGDAKKGSRVCRCLSYIPIIAAALSGVIIGGLVLFILWGPDAARDVKAILDSLQSSQGSFIYKISDVYKVTVTATCIAVGVSLLVLICLYILHVGRRVRSQFQTGTEPRASCCWNFLGGLLLFALWLVQVWLVLMIAATVVSAVGTYVLHRGADAEGVTLQNAADKALQTALPPGVALPPLGPGFALPPGVVLPPGVDASALGPALASGNLSAVLAAAGNVTSVSSQSATTSVVSAKVGGACPSQYCFDLSYYAFLGSDSCICNLGSLRQLSASAWQATRLLVGTLIGLAAMYAGLSLLLIKAASQVVPSGHKTRDYANGYGSGYSAYNQSGMNPQFMQRV